MVYRTRPFSERNEGYLDIVAGCWASMSPPSLFDGHEFHEFSIEFEVKILENLSQRILEPHLIDVREMEVLPRRKGVAHIARRSTRLVLDLRICLRRIAHYHSITIEQRLDWQRWMLRTRVVDEHLKDLFTNGLETQDGGIIICGYTGYVGGWNENSSNDIYLIKTFYVTLD